MMQALTLCTKCTFCSTFWPYVAQELMHKDKSHDWVWISSLIWGGVRRKFLLLVKMAENLVRYARNNDQAAALHVLTMADTSNQKCFEKVIWFPRFTESK